MAQKVYDITSILNSIAIKNKNESITIFLSPEHLFLNFATIDDCLKYILNETWAAKLTNQIKVLYPFDPNNVSCIKIATMLKFINSLQYEDLNLGLIRHSDKRILSMDESNFIHCQNSQTAKELVTRIGQSLRDYYVSNLVKLHNKEMFNQVHDNLVAHLNNDARMVLENAATTQSMVQLPLDQQHRSSGSNNSIHATIESSGPGSLSKIVTTQSRSPLPHLILNGQGTFLGSSSTTYCLPPIETMHHTLLRQALQRGKQSLSSINTNSNKVVSTHRDQILNNNHITNNQISNNHQTTNTTETVPNNEKTSINNRSEPSTDDSQLTSGTQVSTENNNSRKRSTEGRSSGPNVVVRKRRRRIPSEVVV